MTMYLVERFEKWAGDIIGDYNVTPNTTLHEHRYAILPLAQKQIELQGGVGAHLFFMRDMLFRHPVMYFLFYRWWLLRSLPDQGILLPGCDDTTGTIKQYFDYYKNTTKDPPSVYDYYQSLPIWARFAIYHPIFVLLWIAFRTVCKFLEQFLTAPVQISRWVCSFNRKFADTNSININSR